MATAEQQNSRTAEQQNSRTAEQQNKIKLSSVSLKILVVFLFSSAVFFSAKAQINTLTSDTLWSTQGNSVADTNLFIGTITQQDFAIKTASQLQAIIKTDGKFAIGVSNLSQNLTSQFTVFEKGQGTQGNHVVSKFVGKVPGQQNPGMQYSYKIGNNGLVKHNQVKFLGDYDLQFKVGSSNAMIIQSTTGNVGIGETNPQYKLSVDGTIQSTSLQGTGDHFLYAKGDGSVVLGGPILGGGVVVDPTYDPPQTFPCTKSIPQIVNWGGDNIIDCNVIGSKNNAPISLITNSLPRINIGKDGRIGINAPSLLATLHVQELSGISGAAIFLAGRSGQEHDFVVSKTGNVGVHTSNPGFAFHVDGGLNEDLIAASANNKVNFKVNSDGIVFAREIELFPDFMTFPDYVFEKDYKLKTLPELKDYIETNKHLPNIPSAKEVEKNGIKMADIYAKLLEKVEELTLYTLQQEEKINALQKELDAMKTNEKGAE